MKRIGKGTGKRAARLKVEARDALQRSREAVPVWVMPMARVVESFAPRAGLFDVVIVDEASQSDMLGLIALYLGKSVVVVGDHEQVSPSAVGEKVEDELPIPHHSGWVEAPADLPPVLSHQKITG